MTTTLSPPIRILGIVGILAAVALGLLLFSQHRSSHSSSASLPIATPTHRASSRSTAKPTPRTAPKIVLVAGLPAPIAHALHYSKVVVVALYSAGVPSDGVALQQARQGARSAHAGFAAVNVLNERVAKGLDNFVGTIATPTILIVRRPGKVLNQFAGYTDNEVVAQAAHNVGAGR